MTTPHNRGLLGEAESLSRLESALHGSPADSTELVLLGDSTELTRYANSEIHQNVAQANLRVAVRVSVGRATARVFTNSLSTSDLRAAIEQAVELARLQAPNPQWTPLPSPATGYPSPAESPQCWFNSTAAMPARSRAEAIGLIAEEAARWGFQAFGTYRSTAQELAVVSSTGIRSYAASTTAYLKALVEGIDGTGYSDALDRDSAKIDPHRVAEQAVARCRANHHQAEIDPGDYEAIFEPNAVADMLRFPAVWGMGARQTIDGQSFLSGKAGQPVASDVVSIWDDPTDPRCLPLPIDYEGLPATRVDIIKEGVAQGPVYDAQTAQEVGMRSTGHAANPFARFAGGPTADHIVTPVGDAPLEAMITNVQRGVLVTRFHYTHCPDGKRVIATGTTRDGTFLVEDGELRGALKNLRLEMGVLDLLSSLQETGEGKACQDWWAANGMATQHYFVPTMRFARCTFTGVTTF
ncbi:MAG: TldD/PmbA family protein [Chloroflexia bacterium]